MRTVLEDMVSLAATVTPSLPWRQHSAGVGRTFYFEENMSDPSYAKILRKAGACINADPDLKEFVTGLEGWPLLEAYNSIYRADWLAWLASHHPKLEGVNGSREQSCEALREKIQARGVTVQEIWDAVQGR